MKRDLGDFSRPSTKCNAPFSDCATVHLLKDTAHTGSENKKYNGENRVSSTGVMTPVKPIPTGGNPVIRVGVHFNGHDDKS